MLRNSTRPLGGLLLLALILTELALPGGAPPVRAATLPASIRFVPVVSGLSVPTFVTNAGDGSNRLFILQQTGQIRIFKNGSLLSTPFLSIVGLSGFTGLNGEQGLLGLAFDPHYTTNGFFYITYTTTHADPIFLYTTTLARYHVSTSNPDVADPSSASVLLSIPKKYTNHNGGMLAFGPDGYLYMSMGDGGSGGDPDNNAQNLDTLLGKLLRLDVTSTPPPGQTYVIPSANPFFSSTNPAVKKEIWAYGLRNPWRFSFDRSAGDLFIADVGQNIEEEVDFQAASSGGGQNYGWHILEGNLCYDPSTGCVPPPGYVAPITTYDHGVNDSFGCAITGGYVYRGSASPTLQGVYFYGDFCSGKVLGLVRNPDNSWSSAVLASTGFSISTFGQDEQGEIYLADYSGGAIYRISAATVSISGSVGVNGISLSYTDGTPRTALSAADGSYSITVPYGWSGTVTPSDACLTFNPLSFPYSNIINNQLAQNYTPSLAPAAGCTLAGVSVAGTARGSYVVPPSGHAVASFPGTFSGPVHVVSTNGNIMVSERQIFGSSFAEAMGIPGNQLTADYWFSWYDGVTMRTWISIGAPDTNTGNALVDIYIGKTKMNTTSYSIPPGGQISPNFPGAFNGPVHVVSTNGQDIFTSERQIFGSSFAESMGVPGSQLTTDYWLSWYDGQYMRTWISIGAPDTNTGDALVDIYIGTQKMNTTSYSIPPGGQVSPNFPGTFAGPVHVVSTNGKNLIVTERQIFGSSFAESTGVPGNQLTTDYWFPWYDGLYMHSWVSIGAPNTNATNALVDIYIGKTKMNTASYSIPPGGQMSPNFPGTFDGPVHVVSTNGQNILVTERQIYGSSFAESVGVPGNQLTTDYWFPWYDGVYMQTWVSIGKP